MYIEIQKNTYKYSISIDKKINATVYSFTNDSFFIGFEPMKKEVICKRGTFLSFLIFSYTNLVQVLEIAFK